MRVWTLALLAAASLEAQSWVKGEIGFRLTIVPADSPAARAGLKIADILPEPNNVRPILQSTGDLPVYRFNATTGKYTREQLKITFKDGEEKRLGVTGDLGFLVIGIPYHSIAQWAHLEVFDFLPQIDDRFVHELKDMVLVEGTEVRIYITRWSSTRREFGKLIEKYRIGK